MIKKKLISLVDNSCVKCLGHVVPEENPGADTGYAVENASVGCLRNSLVSFYKNRRKWFGRSRLWHFTLGIVLCDFFFKKWPWSKSTLGNALQNINENK